MSPLESKYLIRAHTSNCDVKGKSPWQLSGGSFKVQQAQKNPSLEQCCCSVCLEEAGVMKAGGDQAVLSLGKRLTGLAVGHELCRHLRGHRHRPWSRRSELDLDSTGNPELCKSEAWGVAGGRVLVERRVIYEHPSSDLRREHLS